MSGYNGTLKIYPAAEMLAIDMAEALRAASTFNGIIQGCGLSISQGELTMTPGRVLIGGRLGTFEAQPGETTITIEKPTGISGNVTRLICIVCDLGDTSRPLYVDWLTGGEYDAKNTVTNMAAFNVHNGSIALKIASIKIDSNGTLSELKTYSTNPDSFPEGKVRDDRDYVDTLNTRENSHYLLFTDWINYFKTAKHRSAFFRRANDECNIVADGLTIPANGISTFQFRPEYNSAVVIKPESGTAPARPNNRPYVYINPDGSFVSGVTNQSAGPGATAAETKTDRNVPSSLNNAQKNCGIVGIRVGNASSGGSQGDKCYVQSYYYATSGQYNTEYIFVKVRNTSTAAAKIKLTINCLYVQNIDF